MPTPDAFPADHIRTAQAMISALNVKRFTLYMRREVKTEGAYRLHVWAYMRDLFTGQTDEYQFIDSMVAEIENQFGRAYREGAKEVGLDPRDFTDEDQAYLDELANFEKDQLPRVTDDILKAKADGLTPEQFSARFQARAGLWSNRYNEIVNEAKLRFGGKQKLEWVHGDTLEVCETCDKLTGVVAFAEEWNKSGYRPQNGPNPALQCGGWNCDCRLEPTDKPRTRGGIPE